MDKKIVPTTYTVIVVPFFVCLERISYSWC